MAEWQAKKEGPIGIYDSGIGGASFLWKIKQMLPQENYIYYGDLAFAPYGDKTPAFVQRRARQITKLLRQKGCKALVIACNTATSSAADCLRKQYPEMIILGMEPAIQLAINQGEKKIIVLSTQITSKAVNTLKLITKNSEKAELINLACPGLMELVEQLLEQPEAEQAVITYLRQKLQPHLQPQEQAAVVLGCTHYLFIPNLITALFPCVRIYDGNQGTANHLIKRLQQENLLKQSKEDSKLEVLCSDQQQELQQKIGLFLAKLDMLEKTK